MSVTATVAVLVAGAVGCSGLRHSTRAPCDGEKTGCDYDRGAKTLLAWAVCEEKDKGEGGGGTGKAGEAENGNGEKDETNGNDSGEETPLASDRPDFTEASSTVGRGRVQLEGGYTYFRDRTDGGLARLHSYPELLLRAGVFADWFELRLGQNFVSILDPGVRSTTAALDLYVGAKVALTEQAGVFPETAVIAQAFVPTGGLGVTAHKVLPGLSLLYGWDLAEDWTLAGSALGNKAVDDTGHGFTVFANSLTLGHSWTDKLGGYFEYFAFFPHGAVEAGVRPEYYLDGGFTYLVTPNFQLDVRAGVGLNRSADDFFAGSGFVVRY
jgi:hypothetical protein